MESFPDKAYESVATYFDDYALRVTKALASVDRESLERAERLLSEVLVRDGQVFSCGNGGSASIANHLVCDHSKAVSKHTNLTPRVRSLTTPIEIVSAYANDVGYADVFVEQAKLFARAGDLLITISSSGDSDNVVKAVEWAKANNVATIAMTGFSGGRLRKIADVSIHVEAANYGIVEDAHQSIMHALAQFIRVRHVPEEIIAKQRF